MVALSQVTNGQVSDASDINQIVTLYSGGAVFDVKAGFGAAGDGSADDTAEIQNAVDTAAAGLYGGTVFFPAGFFRITAPIVVPTSVHLRGSGIDATNINNESSGDSFHFGDGTLPNYICFSSIRDMTIDRNASATPNAAIYINWATQVQVHDVRVLHHAYGVYGEFSDQNTFMNVEVEGATGAAVRLGGPNAGKSSNFNVFNKCLFSGGPYGVLFEGNANQNVFIDTPLYSHTTAAAKATSGLAATLANKFIRCWLEESKGFDIRSGSGWLFQDTFFGNSFGDNPFQSTCVFDASSRILNTAGDGVLTALNVDVEFAENGTGTTNESAQTIASNRSFVGESSHIANLAARGLAAYSFAAAGLGQGAKEKNLNGYPDLTTWTLYAGTAVSGGQADPLGGTGAYRLATNTVVENKVGNANGGSALTGATFTIQCLVKSNGGKLTMQLTDDVNAGSIGHKYIALPLDGWHVVSWTYKFPTGSTGTTLNLHLSGVGSGAVLDIYWPVETLGRAVVPWLPAACDMSGWNGPYEVFGANHCIRVYGTAAPGSGTWRVGDQLIHSTPAASGNIGWVCTTAGTPGTWKTFGAIAA